MKRYKMLLLDYSFQEALQVAKDSGSNNSFYGIPKLREDMISSYDGVLTTYAGKNYAEKHNDGRYMVVYASISNYEELVPGNVLSFYADDIKFSATWNKAEKFTNELIKRNPKAVLNPDYSLWRDEPLPEQIYSWYKSMLIARTWQEMGISIIPSLNWSDERSYKFCFEGIPKDLDVVYAQCRTLYVEDRKYFIKGLVEAHKRLNFKKVILYGGELYKEARLKDIPEHINWQPLNTWNEEKRYVEKMRSRGIDI